MNKRQELQTRIWNMSHMCGNKKSFWDCWSTENLEKEEILDIALSSYCILTASLIQKSLVVQANTSYQEECQLTVQLYFLKHKLYCHKLHVCGTVCIVTSAFYMMPCCAHSSPILRRHIVYLCIGMISASSFIVFYVQAIP